MLVLLVLLSAENSQFQWRILPPELATKPRSVMAVNARIKTQDEFHVGTDRGPPLVYLDLGVGDEPPRRLHIEVGATTQCLEPMQEWGLLELTRLLPTYACPAFPRRAPTHH
jgi:hypothetical protein